MRSKYAKNMSYTKKEKCSPLDKQYFIYNAAARTGFSRADLNEVFNVFEELLLEAIQDVFENPTHTYNFGPFHIWAKKVTGGEVVVPATKERVAYKDSVFPSVKLREGVKDKYRQRTLRNKET